MSAARRAAFSLNNGCSALWAETRFLRFQAGWLHARPRSWVSALYSFTISALAGLREAFAKRRLAAKQTQFRSVYSQRNKRRNNLFDARATFHYCYTLLNV